MIGSYSLPIGSYFYLMSAANSVSLMSAFPNFKAPGFDMASFNQQFRERNMIICARSRNIHYEKHWGCLSVKFVIRGAEYYQTDHSRYAVNCSNFLILNRDTEYSSFISSPTEVESFTLNFGDDFTKSVVGGLVSKPEDVLEGSVKTDTIRMIERVHTRENNIYPIASKIYHRIPDVYENNDVLSELFVELLSALAELNAEIKCEINKIQKVKSSTRKEIYKRLNYAKDFIDSCFSEDLNVDCMAAVACMNREYFIRQFKLHYNITPNQYLINKRMESARTLLQSSNESIATICHEVGYSDPGSFGKLFKRYFKSTPENYRLRLLQSD